MYLYLYQYMSKDCSLQLFPKTIIAPKVCMVHSVSLLRRLSQNDTTWSSFFSWQSLSASESTCVFLHFLNDFCAACPMRSDTMRSDQGPGLTGPPPEPNTDLAQSPCLVNTCWMNAQCCETSVFQSTLQKKCQPVLWTQVSHGQVGFGNVALDQANPGVYLVQNFSEPLIPKCTL